MTHPFILFHMVGTGFHLLCLLCSILSLVLNPARKLTYVTAAWDPEYVETGMVRLRKIVGGRWPYIL